MASACAAFPQDLFRKVQKALSIRGPTFIHVLAPCPPGWRYSSEKTVEMGKLAVKTGIWTLWEREYGKLTINGPTKTAIAKPVPVEQYLGVQGRFKGISPRVIAEIQQQVERNLKRLSQEAEGPC
jgi:pyruvate ferredoxin oxidoreductase beta subunit